MKPDVCIQAKDGYAMLFVMLFTAAAVLVLAGVLQWSSTHARLTARRNEYNTTLFVSESVLNRVIAQMSQDFQQSGSATVDQNLSSYQRWSAVPGTESVFTNYAVSDLSGTANAISVTRTTNWNYLMLQPPYSKFYGRAATYHLGCQATSKQMTQRLASALQQDLQLASMPLFQFGVFYHPDLEVCPSSTLNLSGAVHCNNTLYTQPNGTTVTFAGPVSAAQDILQQKNPSDPTVRSPGTVQFLSGTSSRLRSITLPIGGSNSPTSLHAIIDPPPSGELISSALGQQRFYNKADLIILVSNSTVVAKSGAYNNFATQIPWSTISSFIQTNVSFYDKRETKTIQASQMDVSDFLDNYWTLWFYLGRYPKTIYLADLRTQSSTTKPGVRLINGQTLPSVGLTVATPNPLYVVGHYNTPNSYNIGTTNTSGIAPAALAADALTFLSQNWKDGNSGASLSTRIASSTTLNAAVICGIVPTGGGYYSGGLENSIRLLEDWTGKTLTFNGSRVVLYYSQTATAPWGASSEVYNPPVRAWSFDPNLSNWNLLPPSTPEARTLIKINWAPSQPTAQ